MLEQIANGCTNVLAEVISSDPVTDAGVTTHEIVDLESRHKLSVLQGYDMHLCLQQLPMTELLVESLAR